MELSNQLEIDPRNAGYITLAPSNVENYFISLQIRLAFETPIHPIGNINVRDQSIDKTTQYHSTSQSRS